MQRLLRSAAAIAMTLVLGACGTGATPSPVATTAPASAAAPATPAAPASAAPTSAAPSETAGASSAAACAPAAAGATATVKVTIKNFAFSPEPVTAKVGDVIGWTNSDGVSHTATLDDGSCTTDTITTGTTQALVFSAPGTYPYHCSIHPTLMMGKITITG
jgi:plastocyanin